MLDERRRTSVVLDDQLALTAKLVAATMARFSSGRGTQGDARCKHRASRRDCVPSVRRSMRSCAAQRRCCGRRWRFPRTRRSRRLAAAESVTVAARDERAYADGARRRPELSVMRAEQQRARADVGCDALDVLPDGFRRTGPRIRWPMARAGCSCWGEPAGVARPAAGWCRRGAGDGADG